jgi:dienelactone hydrolase
MTEIVVFHHAQGLTDGVHAFADELRAAGHRVTTPDAYAGATFDTVEAGVAHAQELGFQTVLDRCVHATDGLPADIVYAGFSLGAMPAQQLAQTRPGARGALLFHGALPAAEFGGRWPAGVPLQIHAMTDDPWFAEDAEAARELVAGVEDAELFWYPGNRHLFADPSLPDYDEAAARLLMQRVLAFLARLG